MIFPHLLIHISGLRIVVLRVCDRLALSYSEEGETYAQIFGRAL